MEATMEKALRPIYQALDRNQFSKALKMTQEKPQSEWPITVALKIHCLHRCGNSLDACRELRGMLGVLGDDWNELDDRIWLLGLGAQEPTSNTSTSTSTSGGNSTQTTSSKNKKKGASQSNKLNTNDVSSSNATNEKANNHLDFIHVLDLSLMERQERVQRQVLPFSFMKTSDILDETTISTVAVTLSSLRLFQTMVQLHNHAIEAIQNTSTTSWREKEILIHHMIQSYLGNLKYIATLKHITEQDKISNLKNAIKAWDENQLVGLNLVKHSGEGMYQSWCVCAALEHYYSCKELLDIIPQNDNEEYIEKLKKKINMLPRLVEMMAKKRVENDNGGFPPSADDWRLVIESLKIQGKYTDAVKVLEDIDISKSSTRKIDDENDIKHHVGSLIQLTQKERLELLVQMYEAAGENTKAFEVYTNHLLKLIPDQWDYWKGMLTCSNDLEKSCKVIDKFCEEHSQCKIPLRGPHLARVEIIAEQVRCGNDSSATKKLANAIIEFGSLFAPLVFCCFQDLRMYLDLLVQQSCQNGQISSEVTTVLNWANDLRKASLPIAAGEVNNSNTQDRSTKLREYIASIKISFGIWYQLRRQTENDSLVYEGMQKFIPSPKEMIRVWFHSLDLGSIPKAGGQKECLPGDDLILLTTQLLTVCESKTGLNTSTIQSLSLLENAMEQSPYNPYLKISALSIYSTAGATMRAWEIFESMDVKQIQLDSCSYLILQRLVNAGLYNESVRQAGKILNLHTTSESDLCKYMAMAFENGNLQKGREMLHWHRNHMIPSLQLLEAKGIIMDLAPLHNYDTTEINQSHSPIGLIHGLCGGDHDKERVEKIVRDSSNYFGAPSILGFSHENVCDMQLSDNRDQDINQFEILERTEYELNTKESIYRSHIHSVLSKFALFCEAVKPPKKGKVVKLDASDILIQRGRSLMTSINEFEKKKFAVDDEHGEAILSLLKLLTTVIRSCIVVVAGQQVVLNYGDDTNISVLNDSLSEREKCCVPYLAEAVNLCKDSIHVWELYQKDLITSICRLIPDILIPIYATINITAKMFGIFGWGKRKRNTKVAAASLADVASCLNDLVVSIKGRIAFVVNNDNDDDDDDDDEPASNYMNARVSELRDTMSRRSSSNENDNVVAVLSDDELLVSTMDSFMDKVLTNISLNEFHVRSRLSIILTQMETEFSSFKVVVTD